eukprot:IDg14081t1
MQLLTIFENHRLACLAYAARNAALSVLLTCVSLLNAFEKRLFIAQKAARSRKTSIFFTAHCVCAVYELSCHNIPTNGGSTAVSPISWAHRFLPRFTKVILASKSALRKIEYHRVPSCQIYLFAGRSLDPN